MVQNGILSIYVVLRGDIMRRFFTEPMNICDGKIRIVEDASHITKVLRMSEGDEVIVFKPYWPEYKILVNKAGGKIVVCNSNTNDFYPDLNDLKNKITNKTKMVIINSPNNPTGAVYNEKIIIVHCRYK